MKDSFTGLSFVKYQILDSLVANSFSGKKFRNPSPKMTINLGNFEDSSVGIFTILTESSSKFANFDTEHQHIDILGNNKITKPSKKEYHSLLKMVTLTYGDFMPDFLCDGDANGTPDYVLVSKSGVRLPVSLTSATVTAKPENFFDVTIGISVIFSVILYVIYFSHFLSHFFQSFFQSFFLLIFFSHFFQSFFFSHFFQSFFPLIFFLAKNEPTVLFTLI